MEPRVPMDLRAYERETREPRCFICAFLAGDADKQHLLVAEDDRHVAFLDRYPTVLGKVLVAPRRHVEHVARDLDHDGFLALMDVVRRVTLAVERVVPSERTYLYSFGSQQGDSHVHWHIAPLPPGTPYAEQQFSAVMTEGGVLPKDSSRDAELAQQIRAVFG